MEYLRNLGSAAASSLLQKSGIAYPFILGERITSYDGKSIWTLHDATKRDDSSAVSVFAFDGSQSQQKHLLPLAKNALRKLRTIRHPDVVKFLDVFETDTTIHIVTERVQPLARSLELESGKEEKEMATMLIWGLHRVSSALAFINESVAATHGNVRLDSLFVATTGEWRLGGFEVLSSPKDDISVLYTLGHCLPNAELTAPPEVKQNGWSSLKDGHIAATDGYGLGLLIHAIFNPTLPFPASVHPPHPPLTSSARGAIPAQLFTSYKKCLNPNPRARMRPKELLDIGMGDAVSDNAGFFSNNHLVQTCASLDAFAVASETEKSAFLRNLKGSMSSFPVTFATQKVLPSLLQALEFGGPSSSTILPIILQAGRQLSTSDYASIIIGPVVKLFTKPDRAIRMALLEDMPEYINKIEDKMVTDKIWPDLQTGFSDTIPIVREATVRSIVHIHTKLSSRILNNDLLRQLAKMQLDPEASIRTNTCILIARVGPLLGHHTKKKVLVPAFARALKDNFVHARVAGLNGLIATKECFDAEELATKVLPIAVVALVDKEKLVRDQALKAVDIFMKKIQEHTSTMPETSIPEDAPDQPSQGGAAIQTVIINSATGAAGALAGWAISSLGKRIASGDVQSSEIVSGSIDRSASPQLPSTTSSPPQEVVKPSANHTKPLGLQLGPKGPSSLLGSKDWIEEETEGIGAWGETDLMDVHADADDWGSFEAAPAPEHTKERSAAAAISGASSTSTLDSKLHNSSRMEQSIIKVTLEPSPVLGHSKSLGPAEEAPIPILSREDKVIELARRKEERRQRIAQMKEQKKATTAAS